jgi:hypothetical protein
MVKASRQCILQAPLQLTIACNEFLTRLGGPLGPGWSQPSELWGLRQQMGRKL